MPDKTIVFHARAAYQTLDGTTVYEAGQVATLREDMATRWISRGVATDDPEAIKAATPKLAQAVAEEPPAKEPEPDLPIAPVAPPAAPGSKAKK